MITIEDFQKLDIRIGTITNAERLEDSKKLLKLTVDFGEETRTILAGIGKTVENVETLKGKQAPFLVNLEPKELAGVMSEGMILAVSPVAKTTSSSEILAVSPVAKTTSSSEILATSNEDSPVLLTPVTEVNPGSKIR